MGEATDTTTGSKSKLNELLGAIRLCRDCMHFEPYSNLVGIGDCGKRGFMDPVDGRIVFEGQSIAAWQARRDYCGVASAVYFERRP